ncbi:MAG: SPASM domain-containing protein [Nitrososphaerales archaeon]
MKGLKHLVWTFTRAYDKKFAYSLGDGKPLPDELTTDESKMFVKKVADFGVENFFICGAEATGDPMIRKDFMEIIKYTSEYNLAPYVKTSGWKLDGHMVKELASCNCKMIISIAGLREIDDFLRGKGAHERSINGAKLCAKEEILFSLSVVNTKHVVNQIRDLVKLALDIGSKGFSLASLIPQPICVEEQLQKLGPLEPSPEEHEKELNEIYALSKEVGKSFKLLPYDIFYTRILRQNEPSLKLTGGCSLYHNLEGNEWLEVLDNGKAYGCSTLGLMFGDVREDSLGVIMDRIRNSDIVKKLADLNNIKGKCGICEFNAICGGCRAKAYVYTGDMFTHDPLCPYKPKGKRKSIIK